VPDQEALAELFWKQLVLQFLYKAVNIDIAFIFMLKAIGVEFLQPFLQVDHFYGFQQVFNTIHPEGFQGILIVRGDENDPAVDGNLLKYVKALPVAKVYIHQDQVRAFM
jgi:hypothetical protein